MVLEDFHDPWSTSLLDMRVFIRPQADNKSMTTNPKDRAIWCQSHVPEITGPTTHETRILGHNPRSLEPQAKTPHSLGSRATTHAPKPSGDNPTFISMNAHQHFFQQKSGRQASSINSQGLY